MRKIAGEKIILVGVADNINIIREKDRSERLLETPFYFLASY